MTKTRINLALQGGGAHGAFTWGVLDRLLREDWIEICGISGASAGALNGAALKAGLVRSGSAGGRRSLAKLWRDVMRLSDLRVPHWLQPVVPGLESLGQIALSMNPFSPQGLAAQLYTPYAWGPVWRNPLEPVVRRLDFSGLADGAGPQLFVGATCVETGRGRIFANAEVTPKALMASACLPTAFQAVEIEGRHYWDGGFSGNPALFPLLRPELPDDLVIISINPFQREGVPKTPLDIQNRTNEISFNAALLGELRSIHVVRSLLNDGQLKHGDMKSVRIHLIGDDALMVDLSAATKLMPSKSLFDRLKAAGEDAAERFLEEHGAKLGREPSLDLNALFGP